MRKRRRSPLFRGKQLSAMGLMDALNATASLGSAEAIKQQVDMNLSPMAPVEAPAKPELLNIPQEATPEPAATGLGGMGMAMMDPQRTGIGSMASNIAAHIDKAGRAIEEDVEFI